MKKSFVYKGLRVSISDKLIWRVFSKGNIEHAKKFIDENVGWSLADLGYYMFNDIVVRVERVAG